MIRAMPKPMIFAIACVVLGCNGRKKPRGSFHDKGAKFDDSLILVCKVKDTGFICGVYCVGIQQLFFGGKAIRAGHVYGVRIHAQYQKLGLGHRLQAEAERLCSDKKIVSPL